MFSPDIIILDDGFQHRSIARDLDIVLINGGDKTDDHRLLPLGKLRESWHNTERSDILVITKDNPARHIEKKIKYLKKPTFKTRSTNYISDVCNMHINYVKKNEAAFVFSGIGDPSSFLAGVKDYGFSVVGFKSYPDHYKYSGEDILDLETRAESLGAELIITTDKDWVKVVNYSPSYRILIMGITMKLVDGKKFFSLVENISKSVTSPKQTQHQQK